MPDRFMEIVREDDRDTYALYVVDNHAGRVKLRGQMSHFEAMTLALSAREEFGAVIDKTRT